MPARLVRLDGEAVRRPAGRPCDRGGRAEDLRELGPRRGRTSRGPPRGSMRGRRSCQSTWSQAWTPHSCPAASRLAHPGDGLLPRPDVGRGEERPVEHRPQAVGGRGRGAQHLLHEAARGRPASRPSPSSRGRARRRTWRARRAARGGRGGAGPPRPSRGGVDVDLQGEARRGDATPRASSARRGRSRASSSRPVGKSVVGSQPRHSFAFRIDGTRVMMSW